MTANNEPRIYVACVSAYAAGKLHGAWIDAAQDADDIHADIDAMLKESPMPDAEEWDIHDYENFGFALDTADLEKISEIAQAIEEHGQAFGLFAGYVGEEWATVESFDEAYCGEYDSEEDYAYEIVHECYDIDRKMGGLASYFDYKSFAKDLFISDNWGEKDDCGNFHVFRRI